MNGVFCQILLTQIEKAFQKLFSFFLQVQSGSVLDLFHGFGQHLHFGSDESWQILGGGLSHWINDVTDRSQLQDRHFGYLGHLRISRNSFDFFARRTIWGMRLFGQRNLTLPSIGMGNTLEWRCFLRKYYENTYASDIFTIIRQAEKSVKND